jgi:hypothetical protein
MRKLLAAAALLVAMMAADTAAVAATTVSLKGPSAEAAQSGLSRAAAQRASTRTCRRITRSSETPYVCRGYRNLRRLSRSRYRVTLRIYDPNDGERCNAVARIRRTRTTIRVTVYRGSCILNPLNPGTGGGGDTGPVYEGTDPIVGTGTLDANTAMGEATRMCDAITANPRTGYICNNPPTNGRQDPANGSWLHDLNISDPNDGERCTAIARTVQSAPNQLTTSVEQGTCQVRP